MLSEWEMTGYRNRFCTLISKVANRRLLLGGQLLRYKNNLRNALKKCRIDLVSWEDLCNDRASWRGVISEGTAKFEEERISDLVQKRQNRKEHEMGACCCSVCGKVCLSRIGLFGHMKVHKRKLGTVGGHGQI